MRLLWLFLFVHTVCGQAGFGRSYLGNSRLCHTWDCLNKKLNLTDALPPREQYAKTIRQFLPDGAWQDVLDRALETCYENRTRKYTNTCPGQALLHCTVDQMIENCPSESWVKADGCSPLSSIAAFAYMFSQSRYINLEENLPIERRPAWFLKNYFNTKCCNIPQLFNEETLKECGFSKFMFYHIHEAQRAPVLRFVPRIQTLPSDKPFGKVGIYIPHPHPPKSTPAPKLEEKVTEDEENAQDPLECCNMEIFRPQWRSECGFEMKWDPINRLSIVNSPVFTTTTPAPVQSKRANDVRFSPLPCEKQNCIYRRMNVITESGTVNIETFTKLLDNLTNHRPEWVKAKARVMTKCLSKPVVGYDGDCAINDILGCTADILSENCPNLPKNDPCKRSGEIKDGITCMISTSMYRPKNRRQFCALPDLVSKEVLNECNATWTWHLEYIPSASAKPNHRDKKWTTTDNCKESTESTICLMSKMGVLNKYGFLDYFKMKDWIRNSSQEEIAEHSNRAFQSVPFYRDHCSSPKKLLNVIDAMLLTCPISRRNNSKQCTKIFNGLSSSLNNLTEERRHTVLKYFQNIYLPDSNPVKTHTENLKKANLKTNSIYDFGIFNNEDVPPVKLIDLRPTEKTLVILPVYQRMNRFPIHQVNNDGIFRG